MPDECATLEPRVAGDASPDGNAPHVVVRIEHADHMLDMFHALNQPQAFFLVLKNPSADVGVQPDQVGDGGMIWGKFELVWHAPQVGAI
jgi:hypothetical protein